MTMAASPEEIVVTYEDVLAVSVDDNDYTLTRKWVLLRPLQQPDRI